MGKFIDLTGETFGKLKVLSRAENLGRMTAWNCLCECGNEKVVRAPHLRRGEIKSCGCLQQDVGKAKRLDLSGHKYNRLTVLHLEREPSDWLCLCDCGNQTVASTNALRTNHVKSCGCLHAETSMQNIKKAQEVGCDNKLNLEPGTKRHKLTLVGYSHIEDNHTVWDAKCDCGNTTKVRGSTFNTGGVMSCGCATADASRARGLARIGTINQEAREAAAEALIGERFGKLVITGLDWKPVGANGKKHKFVEYKCDCGGVGSARPSALRAGSVSTCGCGVNISRDEQEIFDWLSPQIECQQQLKLDGWRYDIAIPSRKIIIEYNGVWWHSSRGVHKHTHLIRRRVAEDHGYRMITIWSDSYNEDPEKWKRFIQNTLGIKRPESIGARKMQLRVVDRDVAIEHHRQHHIQTAPPPGGLHVGAYLGDDLKAVATIRVEKEQNIITRYTLTGGLSSPGLMSRIIKFAGEHVPENKWVSYCDNDHFSGEVYRQAGFVEDGCSLQLSYTYGQKRVRRERFMKHKLPDIFGADNVDLSKSEKEICEENKVYQVYNSGITRYVKPL